MNNDVNELFGATRGMSWWAHPHTVLVAQAADRLETGRADVELRQSERVGAVVDEDDLAVDVWKRDSVSGGRTASKGRRGRDARAGLGEDVELDGKVAAASAHDDDPARERRRRAREGGASIVGNGRVGRGEVQERVARDVERRRRHVGDRAAVAQRRVVGNPVERVTASRR